MNQNHTSRDALFPIRIVAERTGVNPVTLRAWERRHGLIKPQRTPKGHRLYSARNLAEIRRILELLERGVPISRVRDALHDVGAEPDPARPASGDGDDAWSAYRAAMLEGVSNFNTLALEAAYNDALSLYPLDTVSRRLIEPLFHELDARWQRLVHAEGERNFFTGYLRNKLGARFHHQSLQTNGPRLLVSGVPGGGSDIALLLLGLGLLASGYSVTLLGADCPLAELEHARRRAQARGVVLCAGTSATPALLERDLPRLLERVGAPVFIAGQGVEQHGETLRQHGLIVIPHDIAGSAHIIRAGIGD